MGRKESDLEIAVRRRARGFQNDMRFSRSGKKRGEGDKRCAERSFHR
jgi:hypothetical protein